ncbi:CYTH and CHAD domain-containing protein [Kocuria palustris]|uniref:CYTH and CHAD domain-containing protein n=1 Tax=Kocuria palustris TaxID=71999 RepID=UPI0024686E29|nr:CYTH and CHAD domain-containing protein [Kocuria palustris]MDH5152372.1 CYTH and CHAD domain-containing protein [Kocuria palustris]
MTPSTQPEIERKYEVPAGAEPVWDDMPRLKVEPEQDVRSLEATYYDTATGSLAAFGLALRRRRGGPDEGWHLKYRADGVKHEVHVPLLRTADRLPAQMRQLISGLVEDQPLEPLAVLRNERQVLQVHDPEHGRVAEICLDNVRGTESATGITRVWQEHEVELVNGTQADPQAVFDEIETVLLAAGLRPSASAAKIARTLGAEDDAEAVTVIGPDGEQLPGTQPEDSSEDRAEKASSKGKKGKKDKKDGGKKGKKDKKDGGKKAKRAEAAPEPGSEPSTEQIVRTALLGAVRQIQWMDFLVRIGAEPAVHGLRRAARSCEALLDGLGPDLADPQEAAEAGRIVREMSQELSALRDAEVVEQLLPLRAQDAGEALSRSAAAHLETMARENREAQTTAARRRLLSSGHQESLRALGEMLDRARLSESAAEWTPKKLGSRMTERWLETVRQLGPVPAETVELEDVLVHVHAVRRALRLLSFGSEVFELTALRARKSQTTILPSAEGYLETCGDLMDCRVMDLWYASAARALVRKGGDRYGVGILHGRERARLEASAEDSVLILEELFDQLEDVD